MMVENGPSSATLATVNVLIIEDDELIGATLVSSLKRAGMQSKWATNGTDGLVLKRSFQPDVVLVDLNLPDADGFGLVAALARDGDCGIIIVSGMIDEADRIVGLEIGADDYISKPPQLRELLARIRAVYRRVKARTILKEHLVSRGVAKVGSFSVNFANRIVHAEDGTTIMLTAAEFAALETLVAANGHTVSRDRLSEAALRRPWHPEDRSVDQLIFSLRHKLTYPNKPVFLHTIRGAGYMLSIGNGNGNGMEDGAIG